MSPNHDNGPLDIHEAPVYSAALYSRAVLPSLAVFRFKFVQHVLSFTTSIVEFVALDLCIMISSLS